MKTPEVRIFFSWLLYDTVSVHLDKLWNKDGGHPLASPERCEEYAEDYRKEWAKYADNILPRLTGALGVEFYKTVIDATCVPWVHAISDPLTFNFRNSPDQFVDALTHELCHILLTDNTAYSIHSSKERVWLNERWAKLFGGEYEFTALVHIPVHALCKYIYLDVLKDSGRLERDLQDVKDNEPYRVAWDYVESHDYKEIIAQLKQDYKELKKETQSV